VVCNRDAANLRIVFGRHGDFDEGLDHPIPAANDRPDRERRSLRSLSASRPLG
jgi:hypothetical protein